MAYLIAWAAQNVDVEPRTEPLQLKGVGRDILTLGMDETHIRIRRTYHFRHATGGLTEPDSACAAGPVADAIVRKDTMQLGIALHAFQDSWSHKNYESKRGHFADDNFRFGAHKTDWPWNNPEDAMAMAKRTFEYLSDYYRQTTGKAPLVTWNAIEKDLQTVLLKVGSQEFLDTYKNELKNNQANVVFAALYFDSKMWKGETNARVLNWKSFIRSKLERDVTFESKTLWTGDFLRAADRIAPCK